MNFGDEMTDEKGEEKHFDVPHHDGVANNFIKGSSLHVFFS